MNDKLDYSNLSAVELKAIMYSQMNCEKKDGEAHYLPLSRRNNRNVSRNF